MADDEGHKRPAGCVCEISGMTTVYITLRERSQVK